MENLPLKALAKRLNLTDHDVEEYILTEQEGDIAVSNAIEAAKKHKAWKLAQQGFSEFEVLNKISEIDWVEQVNPKEILKEANSSKHQDLWHKEQRAKEKEAKEKAEKELKERWSAENMFQLMKWTSQNSLGKKLIVHNDNRRLISALCFFLSGDSRLEKELEFSPNKGLLIRGVSGLGKTHLVRCLEKNELNPILILSMIEIADEIKQNGEYEIKLGNNKVIYLDDVGTEEATINHYGTKINFFKNFIEGVYLRNKVFNKLIISTNNSFAEIEERYGFRVRSRIKDMFNIIDVKGTDMRG